MRIFAALLLTLTLARGATVIPIQVDASTKVLASPVAVWTNNAAGIYGALSGLVQPYDAELTAFAGLSSAADAIPYFTGTATMGVTTLTPFMRTLMDDADSAAARATLGVGTGDGSVTTVSVATANGFSGTVANDSTTPAITIVAGDITPTKVNGNTITTGTGTLTLGSATLNAGPGGTLNTAAFQDANVFEQAGAVAIHAALTSGTHGITSAAATVLDDTTVAAMVDTLGGASSTGSGGIVRATSPSLVTPSLGVASANTVNKLTITSPATGSTLTIDDGKTLRASASLTLTGTDVTTHTFPTTSSSVARIDAAQSFAGVQTFSDRIINTVNGALSAPAVSITGTPITGGSATTTAPLLLVGSGAAGGYSTSGTVVDVNAPTGFVGNLIAAHINGANPVFRVTGVGTVLAPYFDMTSSSGALRMVNDTYLTRKAAANFQLGDYDAAAPVAQTLSVQSVVAGTTDTAGADFTVNGSRGTGTAKSGNIVRKTGNTTTTGSSQHTLSTREMVAAKFVDLTSATATTLFTVTVGTASYIGITVDATVFASDSTDHQALHSVVNISAVNKAGTITATVTQVDGTVAASAGTLTPVTYTVTDNGSGVMALKVAATSSLTETVLRGKWQARINSNDAATVTPQ